MALPFIILGVAAAAAAYGGKKAYDGHQKKEEANLINDDTKEMFETAKRDFENAQSRIGDKLSDLGQLELAVGETFGKFDTIASELIGLLNQNKNTLIKISAPKHSIGKVQNLAISATEYLSTVVGAGATGGLAGFAVYSGVMAFASASTGTSIATLSGAAAYNATMAAIGGGSLAAGGWGMAGGAMVLGTAVAAPLIAIAGWAYNNHGEKAKKEALDTYVEAKGAVDKINLACNHLSQTFYYVDNVYLCIGKTARIFLNDYFNPLKEMHDVILERRRNNDTSEIEISDEVITMIDNGYKLAAIMTDVITTPLFKPAVHNNGKVVMKEGALVLESDENGLNIPNEKVMRRKIKLASA